MAQPRVARRRHAGAMVAVLLAFTATLLGLLPGTATASTAAGPAAAAPSRATGRVVLIGVPGLRWDDVNPRDTPNLWKLTGRGAAGSLSAKTVAAYTCPIDGWLTVSAGQRSHLRHGNCGLPPVPEGESVPGFAAMREDNAHNKYGSRLGLLGDAVHKAGGCTMAVGPGAVFGAADGTGRVDAYFPSVARTPKDGWSRCALAMVDVDDVFRAYIDAGVDVNGRPVLINAKKRAAAAARADDQIGRVMAAVPQGTTVLVAGLSDSTRSARLHVAVATGPGYGPRYLTAGSTHTRGLVTLTDVTTTILRTLHIAKPKDAVGSVWHAGDARPASTRHVVARLTDRDTAAREYGRFVVPFKFALLSLEIALFAFAIVALRARRRHLLVTARVLALAATALPVSSFLVNLAPWWQSSRPGLVMTLLMLAGVAAITALALAGPWHRSVTGSGAVVAGVTAVVLTLDVMTGSHLQNCTVLGYTPVVAGRFYGFGNTTWALWIAATIMAAGALAGLRYAGPRRSGDAAGAGDGGDAGDGADAGDAAARRPAGGGLGATAVVVGIGLLALVVDGAPMLGVDFGGVIAVIPGFAVFAFMVSGRRIRPARLLAVLVAGGIAVLGLAFLDSLRANPTHIGEFWDSLMNGDAGTVVLRKFRSMIHTFSNWPLAVLAAVAVGFLVLALQRPLSWRGAALHRAYERAPALRATLVAVLVTAGVGMLVNDSGVAIPAMAVTIAVPLALAASLRALELDEAAAPPRQEPSEEASARSG